MNKGRGFQNGWWLVVITFCVMWTSSMPQVFADSPSRAFIYMLLGELVLVIPVVIGFFMIKNEGVDDGVGEAVGFRGFPLWTLPFILFLPIAAQSFSGFIAMPIQSVLTLLFGAPDYTFLGETGGFWQNFVILCILAPLAEELLCRGVLMSLFRRYGTAKMLLWSSLAFALLHLGADGIITLFLLGLLFGVIRLTTGSVFAAMLAHSASNLYSLLMLTMPEMSAVAQMVLLLLTAVAFPVLLWFYLTRCTVSTSEIYDRNAKTGFSTGLAVMLSIFFIFNLITFFTRLFGGDIFYDITRLFY